MADYNSSYTGAQIDAAIGKANAAIPSTEKGASNGVATLDNLGKVPTTQLPETSASSSLLEKIRDLSDATVAASSQLNINVSDFDWVKYSSVIVQCDGYGQGANVNFGVRVNNHTTDYAMCRLHVGNPTTNMDTNNLLGAYSYIYKSSTPPQPLFIEIWNLRFLSNDGDPTYCILSSIRDSAPSITLGQHYGNGDLTTINICNFSTVASVILGNMSLWGVLR